VTLASLRTGTKLWLQLLFLGCNSSVTALTQKFCEPGHSDIQETDNLHSEIETVLQPCEIYSPLGLTRVLSKTPRGKPLKLRQLRMNNMRDYLSEANCFRFDCLPFSKVKAIRYMTDNTYCKTSFTDEWTVCHLPTAAVKRNTKAAKAFDLHCLVCHRPCLQ